MEKDTNTHQRAVYSDEFKRLAVLRLREKNQTAVDLALELGVRRNQLYKWAKKFDDLKPGEEFRTPGRPCLDEADELGKLRRRLEIAEEELAILKKFDAYLTHLAK